MIPLRTLILLAGLGQAALCAASPAIPVVLGWRAETAKLRPLTGQVFWTYAGYIWVSHIFFAALSIAGPDLLLDGTPLAAGVAGFITLWWGARLVIQFTYFDRTDAPPGMAPKIAEMGLVALFAACALVYGAACWQDVQALGLGGSR